MILRFHEVPSESSLRLRLSRHWVTDYVHASEWGKRQAESLEPAIQRRRSHVLPNLVRAPTEPRPEVMEESPKRILFLGRIVPDKGVDILIQAFSDLLEDVPDVQLDLVGGCSDSEYEQEIQEAIERHGLEHRVTRHGFQRDTARYFERAAVVAIPTPPSRCREAFGRVAVEAMASGVPAVSFDSGALRDHVLDEETGILCKEESPEALSRALARLLTDRKFRDACARTAAERYQERYGEHAVRQQWLRLFSENEASGCGGGAERRP